MTDNEHDDRYYRRIVTYVEIETGVGMMKIMVDIIEEKDTGLEAGSYWARVRGWNKNGGNTWGWCNIVYNNNMVVVFKW